MADVTARKAGVAAEVEYYLGYLEERFAELEENVATWSTLSSEDKNDFLSEWSIVDDRIRALGDLVGRYGVPPGYHKRYEGLRARIDRDRPLVAGLWER